MIKYILFMAALAVWDIYNINDKKKSTIIIYLSASVLATAFIIFYFSDPMKPSLTYIILDMLKIDY